MKIERNIDENDIELIVVLEKEDKLSFETIIEELEADDLSFYISRQDGWSFLYDERNDVVFWVTDHGFNAITKLILTGNVIMEGRHNTKDLYEGYEWNEGRNWSK